MPNKIKIFEKEKGLELSGCNGSTGTHYRPFAPQPQLLSTSTVRSITKPTTTPSETSLSLSVEEKEKRDDSAMDAAASQLVYCRVDPFLRSSPSHRHNLLPLRRRSNLVSAVAAEPKPPPPKTLNGSSSKSPPSRAVNGVSSVTLLLLILPVFTVFFSFFLFNCQLKSPRNSIGSWLIDGNVISRVFFFYFIQRIGDVSKEIKRVRAQMEEDEQLASLMRGLRGQNLRDSLFAEDDVQLRLVEVVLN